MTLKELLNVFDPSQEITIYENQETAPTYHGCAWGAPYTLVNNKVSETWRAEITDLLGLSITIETDKKGE